MNRPLRTIFALAMLLSSVANGHADDLDIYGGQTISLQPNVLIIFDNSISMGQSTAATGTQTKLQVARAAVNDLINRTSGVRFGLMVFGNNKGLNDSTQEGGRIVQPCGASKTDLTTAVNGITASTYTPLAETLAEAGRYFAGQSTWFNSFTTNPPAWYSGGHYVSPMQYACQKNFIIIMTDGEPTSDTTNLASTAYINGDAIGDQDGDHCDPNGCLTSGAYSSTNIYNSLGTALGSDYLDDVAYYLSHRDCNPTLGTAGSQYENQNIKVYTIGFSVTGIDNATRLLQATAANGGGEYHTANDTSGLNTAFTNILQTLQETNAIYTPPVIPRNPNNQTDAGDSVYMAFFKPQASGRWIGNLKKFGLVNGVLKDASTPAVTATDSNGNILDTALSYWSMEVDGLKADFGGAGKLLAGNSSRNVYTFTGTAQTSLRHSSNKFTDNSNNPQLTAAMLGVTTTADRNAIVTQTLAGAAIRRSDNATISTWRLGDIVHSEPLSRNFEATYQNGVIDASEAIKSYIFVGANDGMLHVFNAADGSEAWAFVPPGQLNRLSLLTSNTDHEYLVDGSPVIETVKISDDTTMQLLIFGERRGGSNYYALDVTNPDQPVWKYRITDMLLTTLDWDGTGGADGTAAKLGQSWAKPQFKKVRSGNQVKEVFLLAGGYDATSQDAEPPGTDTVGRAIYTVRADNGTLLADDGTKFGLNINAGNYSAMTHSILDVTGFDTAHQGYLNRVYAGDLGGNVFAARYNKCTNAECNNDNWEKMKLLDLPPTITVNSTTYDLGQKFMNKPEATIETGGECVYLGTGDREHPTSTKISTGATNNLVNAFYAVCNRWETNPSTGVLKTLTVSGTPSVSDLVDVTDNLVQQGTATEKVQANAALAAGYGWFLRLPNAGEKITSSPKLLNKKVFFTTFTPGSGSVSSDPCTVSYDYGVSRLYVLDYKTGGAVYDYNASNSLTKDDRSIIIGTSIAAEPVLTTSGENTSMYVGSGGRFQGFDVETSPLLRRYFWRQLK